MANSRENAITRMLAEIPGIDMPGHRGNNLTEPPTVRPWDRLDVESDRAWEAYRLFRDMGVGRTMEAVWRDFGHKDDSTVSGWAHKYFWRARTHAWDTHLDQIAQKAYEEEAATMGKRHAQIGMKLQSMGEERLGEIAEKKELMDQVTPREALEITKVGVAIEREARAVDKGNNQTGAGTIIFNFGTMNAPPKWAPKVIKGEEVKMESIAEEEGEEENGK